MAGETFRFGPFLLDVRRSLLSARGAPVPVGARGIALLRTLLDAKGGVVSRTELLDAAWPNTSVEESNLTVQIATLRKTLGDLSDGQEWIRTIPRVGYQLVRFIDSDDGEPAAQLRPTSDRRRPERGPSIAVLPFRNLGNDPEQDYFADGLSEDLITDLSKVPGLTVIARNSSFAYRGRAAEPKTVAEDLGVSYVIEGSVRRAANRIRINAELTYAPDSMRLWADRFDGDLADTFTLQDDIVGRIVKALTGALPRSRPAETSRAASTEAYDLFVHGRALVMQALEGNDASRPLLHAAIAKDPGFAAAHAWLAMSHCGAWATWGGGLDDHRAPALESAKQAVHLDPANAEAQMILGYVHAYDGDLFSADREFGVALRLNPNLADAWALQTDLRVFEGRESDAIECLAQAFRLNPNPPRFYYWALGFANYAAGRYEDAVKALRHEATYRTGSQRILAASLALLGRQGEAEAEATQFLVVNPGFRVRRWADAHPFRRSRNREHFVEGYVRAGLPL
jgi:TolB-like protein